MNIPFWFWASKGLTITFATVAWVWPRVIAAGLRRASVCSMTADPRSSPRSAFTTSEFVLIFKVTLKATLLHFWRYVVCSNELNSVLQNRFFTIVQRQQIYFSKRGQILPQNCHIGTKLLCVLMYVIRHPVPSLNVVVLYNVSWVMGFVFADFEFRGHLID